MQTGFAGIKVLAMTTNHGQEGNLGKASSCGSASPVPVLTKTTSSVISVSRSMLTLEIMLISTAKNGSNVSNVTSGFIVLAKCKMVTKISLSS